jgi:hypothetical protein
VVESRKEQKVAVKMFHKSSLMRILVIMLLGLSILVTSCTQHEAETTLVYRADLSGWVDSENEAMTESIGVIKARLDALDLQGATVERKGTDQIVVLLPSVSDIDEAITLIGSNGQLEFKELVYDSSGNAVLDSSGNYKWIPATAVDSSGKEVILTGQYLKRNAKMVFNQNTLAPEVAFEFDSEGANLFSQITGRLIDKPLGIFLDNELISSPKVMAQLNGRAVIQNLSLGDARNLAIMINTGALPCPLTLVSKHIVTPTLSTPSPAITWPQPVAAINDTTISMGYFIKMLRYYYILSNGNVMTDTFPSQVLKYIEYDELVRQGAPSLGIEVSPDEIVAKINNDMIPLPGGGWDSTGNIAGNITIPQTDLGKIYQEWLDYVHLSDSEYRYLVEAELLDQKIMDYFTQSVPTRVKQVHVYWIKVDNEGNATEVENRLQNGEDFATLAKEFSTEELTKQYGGDLGWMPEGILSYEIDPQLDQVAFSLPAGNISGPIEVSEAYYIVKVTEISDSMAVDSIHHQILGYKAFSNWFTEQRKAVEIREYLDQTTATWAMNQIS